MPSSAASQRATFGKTFEGPSLSGAAARAIMTTIAPRHWQKKMAAQTGWKGGEETARQSQCRRDNIVREGRGRMIQTVESTQRLQKCHTETDTLDGVKDPEPEPEACA
jgi:hypothetical protein